MFKYYIVQEDNLETTLDEIIKEYKKEIIFWMGEERFNKFEKAIEEKIKEDRGLTFGRFKEFIEEIPMLYNLSIDNIPNGGLLVFIEVDEKIKEMPEKAEENLKPMSAYDISKFEDDDKRLTVLKMITHKMKIKYPKIKRLITVSDIINKTKDEELLERMIYLSLQEKDLRSTVEKALSYAHQEYKVEILEIKELNKKYLYIKAI